MSKQPQTRERVSTPKQQNNIEKSKSSDAMKDELTSKKPIEKQAVTTEKKQVPNNPNPSVKTSRFLLPM